MDKDVTYGCTGNSNPTGPVQVWNFGYCHPTPSHDYRYRALIKYKSFPMKQIINAPESVVLEAIDGLVRCHAHLQRLDGFPDVSPYQLTTPPRSTSA